MEAPIFIVGANRSGTTLLRLILNAHSRIAIPEELVYFTTYPAGVSIKRWREPGLSQERFERYVRDFLNNNCKPLNGLDSAQLERDILKEPSNFKRPYEVVLKAWAQMHGKTRWGEKTPGNLFYVDVLMEMFPDAKFIHIIRDPRAVVASMLKASIFTSDVVFNALNWRKHIVEGGAMLARHVPLEQRMTVHYEDLVQAPEPTIRAVCSFTGESYEPAMLRFHEDSSNYMKEEAVTSFNAAATKPISPSKVDAWRTRLTDRQMALIETVCKREMEELGYRREGDTAHPLEYLQVLIKTMYWNWQCRRMSGVRHYTVRYRMFARTRARITRLLKKWLPAPLGSSMSIELCK